MYINNAFKVIINYIVSITIASYRYRCILFDPNGIYQLVENTICWSTVDPIYIEKFFVSNSL